MRTEALTFRAEPDFIDAIRAYADNLGISVNAAMKEMLAPVLGYRRVKRADDRPRNNLASFCGCLKDVDCSVLESVQDEFSKIDEDMWK